MKRERRGRGESHIRDGNLSEAEGGDDNRQIWCYAIDGFLAQSQSMTLTTITT